MPTQTGSIDFKSTKGLKSYAEAQYATQGQVTTLNTAIEQNARDITFRATKEEAAQMAQPNLSPYFSAAKADVYNATTNPTGYWSRITTNAQFSTYLMEQTHNGSGGWAHFAGNATSNNPFVRFEPVLTALKPSTTYTFLVEWDGTFSNSGNVNLAICSGTTQGDAKDPFSTPKNVLFKGTGAATSPRYITVSTHSDMSAATVLGRSYLQVYGTGAFDCYVRISLYEGEYTGPYKPYVGSQLYASQAELKVTNDEISSKVSKDGIISSINQSAETVKIQASKVEIDGAAIFSDSDFRSAADNAYASKTEFDNLEIGGRNLALNSKITVSNSEYQLWRYVPSDPSQFITGDDYTVSFDGTLPSGKTNWYVNIYSTAHTAGYPQLINRTFTEKNGRWYATGVMPSLGGEDAAVIGLYVSPLGAPSSAATVSHFKIEHGNHATDWSPAPEDIEATATSRSQRIYLRKTTAGAPSPNTTWLSTSGTGYNNWSLGIPPMTSGSTKYPYLYTAVQTQTVAQQAAGNTCSCSAVLIDDTTTVIDGGAIITGSVTANKVDFAEATGTQLKLFDPGSPTNYTTVGSSGMNVVKDGTSVASFGATTRIGIASESHIEQDSSELDFYNANGELFATLDMNGLAFVGETVSFGAYTWSGSDERSGGGYLNLGPDISLDGNKYGESDYLLYIFATDAGGGHSIAVSLNADELRAAKRIAASNGEVFISGTSSYIYFGEDTTSFSSLFRFNKANGKIDFYDGTNWVTSFYMATTSRTANTVLAAPNGSAGAATFRKLVAADLPQTAWTYINSTASGDTNYVRWRYMSGMVTVQLNYANSAGLASGTQKQFGTIGTASYRPDATVTASAYLGSSTDHVASMWVDTSGRVYVRALSAATAVFGTITYPLK